MPCACCMGPWMVLSGSDLLNDLPTLVRQFLSKIMFDDEVPIYKKRYGTDSVPDLPESLGTLPLV